MIPEGLEYASVEEILDNVASVGFNFVRMGYAFEMIDQIYDRDGQDVPLEVSMIMALGLENGTRATNDVVKHNPGWTPGTTRFEIWNHIAKVAYSRGIFVHPDLHIGKAQWCCSHEDGNSWFDDVQFNTFNWHRALAYIAGWTRSHPNIVSISLRNELRESWNDNNLHYNWQTFVGNMSAGAETIYDANPDLLIMWSGMQFDQDLSALTSGKNILSAPCYKCTAIVDHLRQDPAYFDPESYRWGTEKLVWELHLYNTSEDVDTGTCDIVRAGLYRNGFNALGIPPPNIGCNMTGDCPTASRITPVILSEFGQTPEDQTIYSNQLLNCIRNFTTEYGISWMMWSLAGYFRIRQGVQGFVDPKGMFNATWDGWHDPSVVEKWWKPWTKAMNVTRREEDQHGVKGIRPC
ncbi:hypothetical protein VSDG_09952 [Cytospora chrysosperma]|uniref:Glycoside hydrolase family 5 domain-containing protein n=1 Tax=Cytospora chrysosperma TaxID=252740 RepID=A0A423V8Q3_CYTCH|nr:hypothetical protein VSDG_09952 [Valsa sordida]